ncbi:hypothetical protein [Mycoplasma sp. 5370]
MIGGFIIGSLLLISKNYFSKNNPPKEAKLWELYICFTNKERMENSKIMTEKQIRNFKKIMIVNFLCIILLFLSASALNFANIYLKSSNVAIILFSLAVILLLLVYLDNLFKKHLQIHVGMDREKRKTDFLFYVFTKEN